MFPVAKLLKDRTAYAIYSGKEDVWVNEILADTADKAEISFVLPLPFLTSESMAKKSLLQKLEKYSLARLFNVSSPYNNISLKFVMLQFTKKPVSAVKVANYTGKTSLKRDNSRKSGVFQLIEEKTKEYRDFLNTLVMWEKPGKVPVSVPNTSDFTEIPAEEFDLNRLNPEYYSSQALATRKHLKEEEIIRLEEIAEIILPKPAAEEGTIFRFSKAEYPLNIDQLPTGKRTNVILKKGDILISLLSPENICLITNTDDKEIYAPRSACVIRTEKVSPEYLFLYLKSDTGKAVISMYTSDGFVFSHLSLKDIQNLPVIKPSKPAEEYERIFKLRYFPAEKLGDFNQLLAEYKDQEITSTEDLLNQELFENLKYYKHELVLRLIEGDLKEVNACFKAKAYKATLILAGSILEAVLIDWLSELDQLDYFQRRTTYVGDEITLKTCIERITMLRTPDWMEESNKANKIRENRNLVHAKLCLKECRKINEELCREVIGYLEDVIRSRFGKTNS